MNSCECEKHHPRRRVVLTGGPGAGKTAVLELVRRSLCQHVQVLPEAASILFAGGFPRGGSPGVRAAAQRAIFFVQREMERAAEESGAAIVLCDRGTIDGLAYWPGTPEEFWSAVGSTREKELLRYDAVIHLRTPPAALGYNHHNAVRIESAADAAAIDERIARAWDGHPRRFFVESRADFLSKAQQAIELLRAELPDCCRRHLTPSPGAVQPG